MAGKHLSDALLERSLACRFAADCLDRKNWDRFRLTPVIRTSVLRSPVRLTTIARFRRSALTPHSHRGQPASSPLAENCYLIQAELLEVGDDIGDVFVRLQTGKDHLGARDFCLRIPKVFLERSLVPDDA
jgi:hypothetical protein